MEEKFDCGCSVNVGKQIQGVVCDVHNCVYHNKENCCMAGKIAVGPSYAKDSSDTVCATFKPKA